MVTTQLTAKKYKLPQVVGVCGMIIGLILVLLAFNGDVNGLVAESVLAASFLTYIISAVAAWWHHG